MLLMVASDRVSAFDVVLPKPVPRKGEVLTQITAWWLAKLEGKLDHHLVSVTPEEFTFVKYDAGEIATIVAELAAQGLLSDRRFAEAYVRGRFERGFGPQRIQSELRERGVATDLVAETLAELSGTWVDSARLQRNKRFGAGLPEDARERARQMRFLQQRGFTGDQIRAVFRL